MILPLAVVFVMLFGMTAFAAEEAAYVPEVYATYWALVPPVIAIGLALITKEVYSSLFVGILIGALFFAGFNPELTMNHLINDGFIKVLTVPGNVGILIFLVILGTMVYFSIVPRITDKDSVIFIMFCFNDMGKE